MDYLGEIATMLTVNCFRNTFLEDLHCGISPSSKTGDYSDVKVISPYGEIEWNNLSRITDEEMKKLMKEVNSLVAQFLQALLTDDEDMLDLYKFGAISALKKWEDPSDGETARTLRVWDDITRKRILEMMNREEE